MALPIAEVYWSSAANTFIGPPSPERTYVGAYPYLDTEDAGGSYAQLWEIDDPYNYASVRFAPSSVAVPDAVQVRVQAWAEDVELFRVLLFTSGFEIFAAWDNVDYSTPGQWASWTFSTDDPSNDFYPDFDAAGVAAAAAAGDLRVGFGNGSRYRLSFVEVDLGATVQGRLAIDTHDHPFHVVGTRDPAMPYELVIDTGTQRLVEIVAGEEALATHELVIDETGRAGDPWTHCGLFRPL